MLCHVKENVRSSIGVSFFNQIHGTEFFEHAWLDWMKTSDFFRSVTLRNLNGESDVLQYPQHCHMCYTTLAMHPWYAQATPYLSPDYVKKTFLWESTHFSYLICLQKQSCWKKVPSSKRVSFSPTFHFTFASLSSFLYSCNSSMLLSLPRFYHADIVWFVCKLEQTPLNALISLL